MSFSFRKLALLSLVAAGSAVSTPPTARTEDAPAQPAAVEPATTAADKLTDEQLQTMIGLVRAAGYYGLGDRKEAKAVAELRKHPDQAAPLLAEMLADGHKNRKQGWIMVYRPMYVLEGMGPAIKVALPDIIKALEDQHGINIGQACDLLTELGPEAKEAVPALVKAWDKAKGQPRSAEKALAKALHAIDPEAAAKAGVPQKPEQE